MRTTFGWFCGTVLLAGLASPGTVLANHPVLVEGEQDFDGDGLIGAAEDTDNATDQVFGTIAAALGAANAAANQNGHVIIVTSGRFLEGVLITAENGDVTLQAAPGVEAEIEAVRAGDPASADRQGFPGIVVDAPAESRVTIRNIVSRNWTDGIRVVGDSHVLIEDCRIEHNRDHNIRVRDSARVAIVGTSVTAAGFRNGLNIDNAPNPGVGISFEDDSRGVVADSTVSGNFGVGIANLTGRDPRVQVADSVVLFDND
jgi:hypothetical protein